jgi:hypothetical protein
MAHSGRFAQKEYNITASRVDVFTDVGGTFGLYWNNVLVGTGFLSSFGPVGSSPNNNGASTSGPFITLQPADGTHPGLLTALSQSIGGAKLFLNNVQIFNNSGGLNQLIIGVTTFSDYDTSGLSQNLWIGQSSGGAPLFTNNNASSCIGLGAFALDSITSGSNNVAVGVQALSALTSGVGHLALGYQAGSQYTTESNNLCLLHHGVAGDSGKIRIGIQGLQTSCAIQGIYGWSIGAPQIVIIDSNGNLGSETNMTQGIVSFAAVGATPISTGVSISGTLATLQPANGSLPGLLTAIPQSIGGVKTFNAIPVFSVGATFNGTCTFTSGTFSALITASLGLKIASNIGIINSSGTNLIWNGNFGDSNSVYIGRSSGLSTIAGGLSNVGIGAGTLQSVTTASAITAIGVNAGNAYTATEIQCIVVQNAGVVNDNGVIRIGTNSFQNSCFIQGISGVTSTSGVAVLINSTGQLGTTTSSRKYKTAIQPVVRNRILELEAKQFSYKDTPQILEYGFIAEEVNEIMPEVIVYEEARDGDGNVITDDQQRPYTTKDPKTIAYHLLWPLLQDKVKELSGIVAQQSEMIAELLKRIALVELK